MNAAVNTTPYPNARTPVQILETMSAWRRLRSLAIGLACAGATALSLTALSGQALATEVAAEVTADSQPLNNVRTAFVGEPFFLLTDATFGSAEPAQVRLEVAAPQALTATGGIDVVVYRVPDPLAFLKKQRNLHRIDVAAVPAAEGLANALTHLWDSWVVKSRLAWQQIFSPEVRRAVTAQAPALKTPKDLKQPSTFEEPRQFKLLPGLQPVQRFRYPVQFARGILPPKDVMLQGSSSEFIRPVAGNVFVPLGRLAPGLYLVEAMSGQFRAHTLVFVSDTMVVTKTSSDNMLVWSANRGTGQASPAARVVWSDGVDVLQSGSTDASGLLRLSKKSPETSYVFGQDRAGGVFVSENFYYDSEIYNAKVYATTDRPLYRPGDPVKVKVTGREFTSARESVALADGQIDLQVNDPTGKTVATQSIKFSSVSGGDGEFWLPDNAPAGGYEMMLSLRGERYTAAFRVGDYQKPHFEITWRPAKVDFSTGEPVTGKLQLNYPDGKPVSNARVSLGARAQRLSMVEGDLDYTGAFPVKMSQDELVTDGAGEASFMLPAAAEPSRYTLTALATDGAAYRVRSTSEVLVERGSASFKLTAERQFSKPNERMNFVLAPSQRNTAASVGVEGVAGVITWEWVRLEDRSKDGGPLKVGEALTLAFDRPGSYILTVRDGQRRIVAATNHFVSGDGQKAPAGSIGIVFDRGQYQAGDVATALVTFPEPAAQALVTLERDQVDAAVLLTKGGKGLSTEKLSATQWKVRVPVTEQMSPNVTLSVATVKNGDSIFQNQGLSVMQPRIALRFKSDKAVYNPGETVNIELITTVAGRASSAEVTVGVVDEMIYVLQPEIAPSIDDFFYHPRKNNVRTSMSFGFIGYDLATRKLGQAPNRRQVNERALKVLERPRREDVDTAAWVPTLRTDAQGRATFSFKMPDSLTRWRITGRAMNTAGLVGQQTAWVRSDKPYYMKWTGPTWQREGDRALASVAIFNNSAQVQSVEWSAKGTGLDPLQARNRTVSVKPGINFVQFPLNADGGTPAGATTLSLALSQGGQVVDRLDTPLRRFPLAWRSPREVVIEMKPGEATPLNLPPDATRLRATLSTDPAAASFSHWLDALVDDPFGCVEQTASRMLPLSLALQSLSAAQQPLAPQLTKRLAGARLSLAQMAGPEAVFGWWGRGMDADSFLTAYAYYADWRALQAMRSALPAAHWERLLDVYARSGASQPLLKRALALNWMREMGLPVSGLQNTLMEEALQALSGKAQNGYRAIGQRDSVVLTSDDRTNDGLSTDMALVLAAQGVSEVKAPQRVSIESAAARLAKSTSVLAKSLLLATGKGNAEAARALLAQVRGDLPTFDRAQSLIWLHQALGGRPELRADALALAAPWHLSRSSSGDPQWQWPEAAGVPKVLGTVQKTGQRAWASLSFESTEPTDVASNLPVRIERALFKVVTLARPKPEAEAEPQQNQRASASRNGSQAGGLLVRLEPVSPGTQLDTNALYLDQLSVHSDQALRWALLEAALPPGASVEARTWGLEVQVSDGKSIPLERAVHVNTAQGYGVPVDALAADGKMVVRHLVRFSQRGQFKLPAPRLYRMYQPESKASNPQDPWMKMEVK